MASMWCATHLKADVCFFIFIYSLKAELMVIILLNLTRIFFNIFDTVKISFAATFP